MIKVITPDRDNKNHDPVSPGCGNISMGQRTYVL